MNKLKLLLALLVIVAAVYVGFQVVPAYYNFYTFQDAIAEEARIQSYTGKSEADMRQTVWKKVQELELPIASPDQIHVERAGPTVTISTEYTVHIDVPIYPFDLKFAPSTRNKQI